MRSYVVQPGDTPAKIASRENMAGCPKCSIDLVRANPHKPTVRHPNGFLTFRELRVGETLRLPDKWWSKEFDALPPEYFKALPHPDGVTPSKLGALAAGVLGSYSQLDAAMMAVSSLATKDDRSFYADLDGAASLVDESVREAYAKPTAAQLAITVRTATDRARLRNLDFGIALDVGDRVAATTARLDAQSSLSAALGAARITLQMLYSASPNYDIEIGDVVINPKPIPSPTPAPTPTPAPAPAPVPTPAPVSLVHRGPSTAALLTFSLIGATLVGGAIYLTTQPGKNLFR